MSKIVVKTKRFIEIGKRLKQLRDGLSQKEFAKKIGVPLRTYQRYESGERVPPMVILTKIASENNITTDWILTGILEKYPYRNIGIRLREIRGVQDNHIFAHWLGMSIPEYNRYEKGEVKPPNNMLQKIAERHNTTIDWILEGYERRVFEYIETTKGNVKLWIEDFWKNASEDEKMWFKIQFQRAFPEYKQWLKKLSLKRERIPKIKKTNLL